MEATELKAVLAQRDAEARKRAKQIVVIAALVAGIATIGFVAYRASQNTEEAAAIRAERFIQSIERR